MLNKIGFEPKIFIRNGYHWSRTDDKGNISYTLHDVPVFACGRRAPVAPVRDEVRQQRASMLTRQFVAQSIENTNRKIALGYLPPVHVDHNELTPGKGKPKVGYMVNLSFGTGTASRPDPDVVYADVIDVPPKSFRMVAKNELPYRSVEILSPDKPEFASLAMMFSTPPFLQFKNLRIDLSKGDWKQLEQDLKVTDGLTSERFAASPISTVCFRATDGKKSSPSIIIAHVGEQRMKTKKKKKGSTKVKPVAFSADGGESPRKGKKPPSGSRIDKLERLVKGMDVKFQSIIDRLNGEDDDAAPIANKAASKKLVQFQASVLKDVKKLDKKIRSREAKEKATEKFQAIVGAVTEFKERGYDVDPESLAEQFMATSTKPLTAAKNFLKVLAQNPPKYEVGEFEEDENGLVVDMKDPAVKQFKAESPEIQEIAAKAAAEYDASIQFAAPVSSREDYVLAEVSRVAREKKLSLRKDYYAKKAQAQGLVN